MHVFAPAKVNLSLRITGRRPDGFHEIETFVAPISLGDELEITRQKTWIDLQCDDPSIPTGEDNLVVRAIRAFFRHTNQTGGLSVRLKKRVPHGAGLGGGSSDAAATLLAMNRLFETNLPQQALARVAERIGSDVPFFVFESAALCRGRGELVMPEKLTESFSLLLLKPAFGVSTPWAYSRWQYAREIPETDQRPQEFHRHLFRNDLERPVFEKFVFLSSLKKWLLAQAEVEVALMSGSGSTLFAVLKDASAGAAVAARAKQELDPGLWTFTCETI